MQYGEFGFLNFGLVLLGAAVLSVPIARRLGLSAIVAYLIAGIIIGPHGLAAFGTPESIIPISELGVVMLLFLIGLELEFGRLVAMRGAIFGLGAAQLTLTAFAIAALGYASGLVDWRGALVATSTKEELVTLTGAGQPNVSKHLAALVQGGLIKRHKVGTSIYYAVADPAVYTLCDVVCASVQQRIAEEVQALGFETAPPPIHKKQNVTGS